MRYWPVPLSDSVTKLRQLLHAQSRIESRIVVLQWLVMVLVGAGALLPAHLIGSGLGTVQSTLVLVLLVSIRWRIWVWRRSAIPGLRETPMHG